jgi:hypothetical protein
MRSDCCRAYPVCSLNGFLLTTLLYYGETAERILVLSGSQMYIDRNMIVSQRKKSVGAVNLDVVSR